MGVMIMFLLCVAVVNFVVAVVSMLFVLNRYARSVMVTLYVAVACLLVFGCLFVASVGCGCPFCADGLFVWLGVVPRLSRGLTCGPGVFGQTVVSLKVPATKGYKAHVFWHLFGCMGGTTVGLGLIAATGASYGADLGIFSKVRPRRVQAYQVWLGALASLYSGSEAYGVFSLLGVLRLKSGKSVVDPMKLIGRPFALSMDIYAFVLVNYDKHVEWGVFLHFVALSVGCYSKLAEGHFAKFELDPRLLGGLGRLVFIGVGFYLFALGIDGGGAMWGDKMRILRERIDVPGYNISEGQEGLKLVAVYTQTKGGVRMVRPRL